MNTVVLSLMERYPVLQVCREEIQKAVDLWCKAYENGGKLLLCGNGGSCADAQHIAGELMKGFLKKRSLTGEQKASMQRNYPKLDESVLNKLQQALPAVVLSDATALNSAFANDVDPCLVYAQQTLGLGTAEDVLVCLSTSGSSQNVVEAAKVAKSIGLSVVALTGSSGGWLKEIADVCITVPAVETYQVQELHLPVYHCLCAAVEAHFFEA